MAWKSIKTAPKDEIKFGESKKILVTDGYDIRVAHWSTVYPNHEGCWKYAEAPTDYIAEAITIEPTHWMPLPKLPKEKNAKI
jgi:hypothetical protein